MKKIYINDLSCREKEAIKMIGLKMISVVDQTFIKICKPLKFKGLVNITEHLGSYPSDIWLTPEGQAIYEELRNL